MPALRSQAADPAKRESAGCSVVNGDQHVKECGARRDVWLFWHDQDHGFGRDQTTVIGHGLASVFPACQGLIQPASLGLQAVSSGGREGRGVEGEVGRSALRRPLQDDLDLASEALADAPHL